MVKLPILRTKSITTKVTESEYARFEEQAAASGQNMSEWVRGKLLEADGSCGDTDVLLCELLALRTILLNLLFSVAKGEPMTAAQMQALIEQADQEKHTRALQLARREKA